MSVKKMNNKMDLNNQTRGGNGIGFTGSETSYNGVSASKGVSGGACGNGIATQAVTSNSDTIFN